MKNIMKITFRITLLAALSVLTVSGGCSSGGEGTLPPQLTFGSGAEVYYTSTSQFMAIKASGSWDISLDFGQGEAWCSVTPVSGSGNRNDLILAYSRNDTGYDRTVTIRASSEGGTSQVEFKQFNSDAGDGTSGGDDNPDDDPGQGADAATVGKRLETPRIMDANWVLDYPVGEFALEYYPQMKHSRWVAWKLHKGYQGTAGRNEAWKYDSRIPDQYQVIHKYDYSGSGYDRGHMCPSADRQATVPQNKDTFYYSNMSPQMPDLNQGIWAKLEDQERGWASITGDTLYICAGGTLNKPENIIGYSVTSQMAIPKYNFKVILRKKASGTYDAIGFWFENKAQSRTQQLTTAFVKTIDDIEALTGLDFFYGLDATIQNKVEAEYRPQDWTGIK